MTSSFPLPTPCPSTASRAGFTDDRCRFALTEADDRTPSTPTSRLSARWNAEWAQICRSRRVAARLRQALAEIVTFHTLDDLLDRCGRDRSVPMAEADEVLAHVVALGATDDDAARVVVQRILPGIVNVAARRSRQSAGDRQALFDELMSALWELVRTYPLDRRPTKIAVNLLRDAEYMTCVRPYRLRSVDTVPLDHQLDRPAQLDARLLGEFIDPTDEVVDLLALGKAAGLADSDLRLLSELHVRGRRVDDLAYELGVTSRTIRNRRHAAIAGLTAVVAAA
jgi:hypothetical protein